ncbi:MAG TPA: 2'-5' RNA ligase family protein [Ktedonobacterales bacterium]|jgi:2'-5' RNA ligase|nr:2'-5' RNA ligase family protein [Ktedonobacterales bacterium]
MHGVVALLDSASEQAVHALWAELDERHHLRAAVQRVPYPHVSYHVAEDYNLTRTGEVLGRVASATQPFTVRMMGLGAFEEPGLVLYLAVERNAALNALHATLWRALADAGAASGESPLYAPGSWIPHITLAQGDLTRAALRAIQSAWAGRDLRREVRVSDLTLLYQPPGGATHTPVMRFALGSAGSSGGDHHTTAND